MIRHDDIRPVHIEDGTQKKNRTDAVARGRVPRGEKHQNAKLTNKQVQEVIALRQAGTRNKDIMEKFGVSASYAGNVTAGRTRNV